MKLKYDIGILGTWCFKNYGAHLTYYALYTILKKRGYKVCLISCPKGAPLQPADRPELFITSPYDEEAYVERYTNKFEMRKANDFVDCFLVGSDQIWGNAIYKGMGECVFLDFVFANKKKIAYAASFGHNKFNYTYQEQVKYSYYLSRFDAISIREKSGVEFLKKSFGVDGQWAIDPVFLPNVEEYYKLAAKSNKAMPEKNYICAYILDYSSEKIQALKKFANEMDCEYVIITDAQDPRKNAKTIHCHKK